VQTDEDSTTDVDASSLPPHGRLPPGVHRTLPADWLASLAALSPEERASLKKQRIREARKARRQRLKEQRRAKVATAATSVEAATAPTVTIGEPSPSDGDGTAGGASNAVGAADRMKRRQVGPIAGGFTSGAGDTQRVSGGLLPLPGVSAPALTNRDMIGESPGAGAGGWWGCVVPPAWPADRTYMWPAFAAAAAAAVATGGCPVVPGAFYVAADSSEAGYWAPEIPAAPAGPAAVWVPGDGLPPPDEAVINTVETQEPAATSIGGSEGIQPRADASLVRADDGASPNNANTKDAGSAAMDHAASVSLPVTSSAPCICAATGSSGTSLPLPTTPVCSTTLAVTPAGRRVPTPLSAAARVFEPGAASAATTRGTSPPPPTLPAPVAPPQVSPPTTTSASNNGHMKSSSPVTAPTTGATATSGGTTLEMTATTSPPAMSPGTTPTPVRSPAAPRLTRRPLSAHAPVFVPQQR